MEIPDVLNNFRRNKMIHDVLLICKGMVYITIGIYALGLLFARARDEIKKDRAREAAIRGFDMPISATYKGSRFAGKEVEGMEGWIDMSRPIKDDDDVDDEDDNEEDDLSDKDQNK